MILLVSLAVEKKQAYVIRWWTGSSDQRGRLEPDGRGVRRHRRPPLRGGTPTGRRGPSDRLSGLPWGWVSLCNYWDARSINWGSYQVCFIDSLDTKTLDRLPKKNAHIHISLWSFRGLMNNAENHRPRIKNPWLHIYSWFLFWLNKNVAYSIF